MRVAVIGLGYWGPNLVRNSLSQPDVEKVIACDMREDRLKVIEINTKLNNFIKSSKIIYDFNCSFNKKEHKPIDIFQNKNNILMKTYGGLGNILFQVASGLNLAYDLDMNLIIKYTTEYNVTARKTSMAYTMLDNFSFTSTLTYDNKYIKYHTESNKIKINSNSNVELDGYFQNVNNFRNNWDKIINLFNDNDVSLLANDIYLQIKNNYSENDLVALHIRGGDYLKLQHVHYVQPIEYYKYAVEHLEKKSGNKFLFIVFTDDVNHSLNILNVLNLNYIFVEKYSSNYNKFNNDELEIFLMSKFNSIICTNSTYSLWASYLSRAQNIYIPEKWFNSNFLESSQMYFEVNNLIANENFTII